MSGVAIAARHSGTAAGKKSFEGEIISSHPGPGDDLTTVTAVVSEPMPKGSILRIRWDGAPYHVECHVDVPAEMQITMHVPKPTSELAMTGLRPNQNAYQALAQRAPLVKAAGANNWAKVKKLVKKGANVDAVDHEGRTALSHACSAGHKETVRMLLAAKATIDLADSTTVTPLMRAVVADKCEIIQMLLKAKADINYTDHNDVSALMVGAGADSLDAVKLLIQEGCKLDLISVNRADSGEGMALSALMFAARQGKIDMVRQLVKNGALLDIESSTNGWTAFHMACSEGEGDIVEILVKAGCNTSVKDVLGRTGKDIAEENGHPEIGDRLRALVVARMREQLMKQQQQKQLEPEPEGDGGDDPQPEEEEEGSDGGVAGSAEGTDAAATAAASKVVTAASAALEPESQSDSSAIVTGASGSGRANSWVRKGSHVVVNDGRMGVVMSEPLSSGKVILRLPDGSETLYIQASNLRLALEEEDYCYREYNPILTFGLKRLLTDKEAKELDATERLTGREFVESPHRPPEMECLWRNKTERLMALEPDGHLRMLHCLPREVIEAGRQTAFEMQGHFLDKYDGIYNQVGEHKGCPRFESATGKQLYYFAESFSWLLAPVFDPLSNKCDSFIAANSGSAGKKAIFVPHFGTKHDHFNKTCLGQT
jgi:ankyrin repeat protein